MKRQIITPIVKVAMSCNLQCAYCYESGSPYWGMRMKDETVENVVTKFVQHNGEEHPTRFIWHGGEPMLMGTGFFERILETQARLGGNRVACNGIQTNGTLVTDDFLDVFAEGKFHVGVSLDGPEWLHNLQRPFLNGNGSFATVMNGIAMLKEKKMHGNGHSLCDGGLAVLTRITAKHLEELYGFFRDKDLNLKINPLLREGKGKATQDRLALDTREYGEAMVYLFDQWFYSKEDTIVIDPLNEVLSNLVMGYAKGCRFAGACYKEFWEIAPNGDVYPCAGRNTKRFCIGNINESDPEDMLASPVIEFFKDECEQLPQECKNCEYFALCHGGCKRQAFSRRKRMSDRDRYCLSYKTLYEHASKALPQKIGFEYRNLSAIQNPILRKVIEARLPVKLAESEYWTDRQWAQWRGDWASDWTSDRHYDDHMDIGFNRLNQR